MSTYPAPSHPDSPTPLQSARASALPLFVFGLVGYMIGVVGLVAWIASTFGLLPFTGGPVRIEGEFGAIAFNVGLILLFGIQHTIMAGSSFKNLWSKILPRPIERVSFTLVTGLLMGAILWLWQPLPGLVWAVESPLLTKALYALAGLGWTYLFVASFAIDHFELFGLRQVWRNMRGLPVDSPTFKKRWMYGFDRHPIMSGALVGMWSVPVMQMDHFVMAASFTLYIMVGVAVEERRLYEKHGQGYKDYRSSVRSLVPRLLRWS